MVRNIPLFCISYLNNVKSLFLKGGSSVSRHWETSVSSVVARRAQTDEPWIKNTARLGFNVSCGAEIGCVITALPHDFIPKLFQIFHILWLITLQICLPLSINVCTQSTRQHSLNSCCRATIERWTVGLCALCFRFPLQRQKLLKLKEILEHSGLKTGAFAAWSYLHQWELLWVIIGCWFHWKNTRKKAHLFFAEAQIQFSWAAFFLKVFGLISPTCVGEVQRKGLYSVMLRKNY